MPFSQTNSRRKLETYLQNAPNYRRRSPLTFNCRSFLCGCRRAKRAAIWQEVVRRSLAIPGVEVAGISDSLPMSRNRSWGIAAKGEQKANAPEFVPIVVYIVSPGYLKAMGMRLMEGRDISWADLLNNRNVGSSTRRSRENCGRERTRLGVQLIKCPTGSDQVWLHSRLGRGEKPLCLCSHFSQVTSKPRLALKIAAVVSHPSTFIGRAFTHRPMILRLVVISMMSNISSGVESPCTTDDHTSAFIGLIPKKFRHIAIAVHNAIVPLKPLTSAGR